MLVFSWKIQGYPANPKKQGLIGGTVPLDVHDVSIILEEQKTHLQVRLFLMVMIANCESEVLAFVCISRYKYIYIYANLFAGRCFNMFSSDDLQVC